MKPRSVLLFGICLALGLTTAKAESSFERDLATLLEQREKAIIAANTPIHERLHKSLERLLGLALNAKDAEAAYKIRQVMNLSERVGSGDLLSVRYPLRGSFWKVPSGSPVRPGLSGELTFQDVTVMSGDLKYLLTRENEVIILFNRGDTQSMKLDASGMRLEFQFKGPAYRYDLMDAK